MIFNDLVDWVKLNCKGEKYLHRGIVLLLDVFSFVLASFITYILYVNVVLKSQFSLGQVGIFLSLAFISSLVVFFIFKFYRIIIRHANLRDFPRVVLAVIVADVLLYVGYSFFGKENIISPVQFELSCFVSILITSFILIGVRVALACLYHMVNKSLGDTLDGVASRTKKVVIYGRLDQSVSMLRQISSSYRGKYDFCGFLDPDVEGEGFLVDSLHVYGKRGLKDFKKMLETLGVNVIMFSSRSDLLKERSNLVLHCTENNIDMFVADGMRKAGDHFSTIEKVEIEDLLNRAEISIDADRIQEEVKEKTVLITGAAGSIGSELVRQLCRFSPKKIVLLDCAETPLHILRLEIEEKYPDLCLCPIIADVRSKERCSQIVKEHLPFIIFHAAAYKHVPLMEELPCESVITNIMGAVNMAEIAQEYGVRRFVMISTDKAVNPTSIMGASKRAAEMYVQSLDAVLKKSGKETTQYITTRFGNVLGSNGSVVPRFREQIAKGGPVTVTHPDIIRFFMTIPEACRLVLQAGVMGQGGEIFVFDMGEPVRIIDMARRMISLSGYKPDEDIKIVYTGLRPGEKLYEEVLSSIESTTESSHHKIRKAYPINNPFEDIRAKTEHLISLARTYNVEDTVIALKSLVPEFKSQNSVYEKYDK